MSRLPIRGHAWTVALLVFATAIAGDAVQSALPCGAGDVIQALQFSQNPSMVRTAAPPGSALRDAAVTAQLRDSYVLIPAYWLLFAAVASLFFRSKLTLDRVAGAIVLLCVTAAAFSDVMEDRLILAALTNGQIFRSPVTWATAKWGFIFLAALALSVPFLLRVKIAHQSRPMATLTGGVLLAGGAIGSLVWQGPDWVAAGRTILIIGLLLMALLFIWEPGYLSEAQSS